MNQNLADHIKKIVKQSLHAASELNRKMNDDPFEKIKPEYLTTVEVCRALALDSSVGRVRMEEPSRKIMGASCPPPRKKLKIDRDGEIDITIFHDYSSFERPSVVIENKNYISGFSGIKEDVKRNAQLLFLENNNGFNSLGMGISTFYWHEARGNTKIELEKKFIKSLDDIKRKTQKLVGSNSINVSFDYEYLYGEDFITNEHADEQDEESGAPANYLNPAFHVYLGMVILERVDRYSLDAT